MSRKYKVTDETRIVAGHTLRALIDFGNVKAGDLGGFIESENNLSYYRPCWVYDEAKIYDYAQVYDNACVYHNAQVSGDADVYGNAKVYGNTKVCDTAEVHGHVELSEGIVNGDADVC